MLKLDTRGQKKCNNDHHTSMLYSRLLLDTITNFIFFSFFLSFFSFFFFSSLSSDWIPWVFSKQLKESHHFQDSFVLTFEQEYYTAIIIQTMHSYNIYFSAKTLQGILPRYLTITMEIIFLHDLDLTENVWNVYFLSSLLISLVSLN